MYSRIQIILILLCYLVDFISAQGPTQVKSTIGSQAALGSQIPGAVRQTNAILTSPGVTEDKFVRAPVKGGFAAPETLFPVGNGGVTPSQVAGSVFTVSPANAGGSGGGGGAVATTKAPNAPTTTFPGYLVGSPYPFVLPPPDIPYFGSKWNGPWGYAVGHYQAFRGTGQYITHYSYYPLSYFGSLMAPMAYGVSGKK